MILLLLHVKDLEVFGNFQVTASVPTLDSLQGVSEDMEEEIEEEVDKLHC